MILWVLFYTFFKIGAFTFGGGYAMLPLIQAEVIKHGWMNMQQLIDFIAVSESTPGPFAVNSATYVGAQRAGVLGSAVATLGVVLPSFCIILALAKAYKAFCANRLVVGAMAGLRPAVIGLIAAAAVGIAKNVFWTAGSASVTTPVFWVSVGIFGVAVAFMFGKKLSPILCIVLSAVLGIACGYLFHL